MPERIMEGRRSAVVARFWATIQGRAVCYGGRGNRITVEHLQMQRDGGATCRVGGLDINLRKGIGHHQQGATDAQLDVANPAVLHHVRPALHNRLEDLAIPLDRGSRVGHT